MNMKSEVKMSGSRLQVTRVFEAPRAAVFGWWSSAEKLSRWSGCKDATACEVEMDFRVGSSFTQKMKIGDKGWFTVTGIYEEIVEPERIVYRADLGPAKTRVVLEFIEQGGRTKVILTQDGLPDEAMCRIVSQGTTESLEKLDAAMAGGAI